MADTDQPINDNVDEEVVDQTQDEAQEEVQEQEVEQEQVEDEQEEHSETQKDTQEEEENPPSRREQLRVQQLLQKYGQPRGSQAPTQTNDGINYQDMIDADPEVYQQLQDKSKEFGSQQYQQGYETANKKAEYLNWNTGLKIDTPNVHKEFPEIVKNPVVLDALNQRYLRDVGYDPKTQTVAHPDLSYYDWVAAEVELAQEMAAEMTATTQRNITRQASRTGIRPDGRTAKTLDLSKDPSQMSDEELDAALATSGLTPKKRN